MVTYAQKLKDPRWQKKRLQVLERSKFECEDCGDDSSTLHVHHRTYVKGREPWEYDEFELACLCENCHKAAHIDRDMCTESLNNARLNINIGNFDTFLAGFVDAMAYDGPNGLDMYDGQYIEGVSHYFKIPSRSIKKYINSKGHITAESMKKLLDRLYKFESKKA